MSKLYPVIPTNFRGLNYFQSKKKAIKYFLSQKWDKKSVEKAILNKEIHIGLPPDIDPKMLLIDKEEGRYFEKFYPGEK